MIQQYSVYYMKENENEEEVEKKKTRNIKRGCIRSFFYLFERIRNVDESKRMRGTERVLGKVTMGR